MFLPIATHQGLLGCSCWGTKVFNNGHNSCIPSDSYCRRGYSQDCKQVWFVWIHKHAIWLENTGHLSVINITDIVWIAICSMFDLLHWWHSIWLYFLWVPTMLRSNTTEVPEGRPEAASRKVHFLTQVNFLKYILNQDGILPDPANIETILTLLVPQNDTIVKGYLVLETITWGSSMAIHGWQRSSRHSSGQINVHNPLKTWR